MIAYYVLAFACGILTKFTDNVVDKPRNALKKIALLTGLLYGLLAGFLASTGTEFATLVIALTIGVLLSGKIDARQHQLALAALFATALLLGIPALDFGVLALLAGLAFLDEILDGWAGKLKKKNVLRKAASARLSLEIGSLALGLALGNFTYFLAILAFDLAYHAVERAMPDSQKHGH